MSVAEFDFAPLAPPVEVVAIAGEPGGPSPEERAADVLVLATGFKSHGFVAPMEVVGFIGNAVGAQAVATVGNRTSVDHVSLVKHVSSLLK